MPNDSATPERMRAWANYWLSRGWHLEPCRIVLSPNAQGELKKRPIGLREGWQRGACTSVDEFERRASEINATGYLIACGPSGVVAVDMDGAEGVESAQKLNLPITFTVETPHGFHAIYEADGTKPVGNSVKRIAPGIDVRGIGGGLFGVGSWAVAPDGAVAGEWRGNGSTAAELQRVPEPLIALAGVVRPDRVRQGVDDPPAASRPAGEPERIQRAWLEATKYFEIMQAEARNPTGRWNNALYGFVRWTGRTMATLGYASVPAAVDEVRNIVINAIINDPAMHEPDERDQQTIYGQAAAVGLRQGPWEPNEQPETIDRWGDPSPFDGTDAGDGGTGAGPASTTSGLPPGNVAHQQITTLDAMLATFFTEEELDNAPDPVPLIDKWLDVTGFALIYGQPGTMKSFLALDMLAHIANGKPWNGHPSRKTGVLYVAGEGGGGAKKRVAAWRELHGHKHGIVVRTEAFDIFGGRDVAVLIDACRAREIGVICLDTLNTSTVGMKENDAGEMGRALANINALRRAGLTVIVVHHTPRDGSNPRGSSALEGASDHGIFVERTTKTTITVTNIRQKDREAGFAIVLTAQLQPRAGSLALVGASVEQSRIVELDDVERTDAMILEFIRDAGEPVTKTAVMRANLGRGIGTRQQRSDSLESLRNAGYIDETGFASSTQRISGVARYSITEKGINYLLRLRTVEAPVPHLLNWGQSENKNGISVERTMISASRFDHDAFSGIVAGQTAHHKTHHDLKHEPGDQPVHPTQPP